jgi:uncharacterized protein (DUF1684 family)
MTVACGADVPAAPVAAPAAPVPADHAATVQAWRDKHESDYLREWVSIAGLHMLKEGAQTVGSAATNAIVIAGLPATTGSVTLTKGAVRFDPAPRIRVHRGDNDVPGPVVLKAADGAPAQEITIDGVRLSAHVTGDRLALRVRNPNGPLAKGFLGFTWFAIDPSYRVVGRFIKDAEPRRMKVLNTFNDEDEYTTEGVIEFVLQGQTLRLRPFTPRAKRFYIVLRDASGGHETYKTARFLYADLADDGTTVLDFNEAYNPPCAFNPYTTCPIPPRENILPVKILAGEKAYPVEVTLPPGEK